jgi:TonB family protein
MRDVRTHGRTNARRGRSASGAPTLPGASVRLCVCVSALALAACRGREPAQAAATVENDVPVAINSGSPFEYPPKLYNQSVEGQVRLRLYVDSAGRVQPESTRVASSSGTPGLDSAAVRGAAQLLFAPAHRNGQPVGMAFYQPVIFRRVPEPPGQASP